MATLADWFSWELWTQAVHAPLLFWVEAAHAVLSGRVWDWYVANRDNILSLATILAGLIGIPLLYIRTRAADRSARAALEQAKVAAEQAKTAADRHNAQTDADRDRRITESFAKAVEQLGSEKLETRLGGIYTLERIFQESEREYWPIMEVLTAYVRERALWRPRQSDGAEDQEKEPELSGEPESSSKRIQPTTDVQAVLTVLGRRTEEVRKWERKDQRLDLSESDLRGADLGGAHLEGAKLSMAHLQDAKLSMAHLKGAYLRRADLRGADLEEAYLEDAYLEEAHLEGAYLWDAHLQGADLGGAHLKDALLSMAYLEGTDLGMAHLQGADLGGAHLKDALLRGADLRDADLRRADLRDADLSEAHLEGAKLSMAHLQDADLAGLWEALPEDVDLQKALFGSADPWKALLGNAKNLTQKQINSAFGDENTILPEGLERPAHWTKR